MVMAFEVPGQWYIVTGTISRGLSCSKTTRKPSCNQEATGDRDACRDMCEVLRQQTWAYWKEVPSWGLRQPQWGGNIYKDPETVANLLIIRDGAHV